MKSISNVNYTYYKQTTILRRIERRMVVNHKDKLEKYADYLVANPEEAKILAREVLIGVTSFFRDSEYFEMLSVQEFFVSPLNLPHYSSVLIKQFFQSFTVVHHNA